MSSAMRWKAFACGLSGLETTIGTPPSEPNRISRSSGISPRKGAPSFSASARAPPCPNGWCSLPTVTDKRRHVLDQTEQRHVHALEHVDALACIHQGDVLGRGDHHGAGHKEFLAQGHLHVTGPRGQV